MDHSSDCRILSGKTREFQGPPSFPYIPGGDVCGTVIQTQDESTFKVGDHVAARFTGDRPLGGLCEYAVVDSTVCDVVPDSVPSVDAAVLVSATPALSLADRIHPGERVLIYGAGGGVGSHLCQFLRSKDCYVAGISRDPERLRLVPLSYDEAVDYTKEEPFAKEEWKQDPFDVVVDLACGSWPRVMEDKGKGIAMVVKPASKGGRFKTAGADVAIFEIHGMMDALRIFMWPALKRAIYSRTVGRGKVPKYTLAMSLPDERQIVTRSLEQADQGKVKASYEGLFDFTSEGVRQAFRLRETRHGKGKVVVSVSKD